MLVIAPHPDDEILGCGGTMATVKHEGGSVFVLIVTVGNVPQYGGESKIESRISEVKKVMEFMGVDGFEIALPSDRYHLRLDMIPRKQLIDLIEKDSEVSINKVKPTIVAMPFVYSFNQDHIAVARATFAAVRPVPRETKHFPNVVLGYEQPEIVWSERPFHPNFYVDISKHLDSKTHALLLYKSQLRDAQHPRNIENVNSIARLRGKEICVDAAEAFVCYRTIIQR